MNSFRLLLRAFFKPIDRQLDRLTTYKLVLYFLYVVLGWAVVAALAGQVSFAWYEIVLSAGWLVLVGRLSNSALSRYLNVPANKESYLITSLILALILSPGSSVSDFAILAVAAVVAMASKYLLTINRWHLFNPAAVGAFSSGLIFSEHASWWVGTKLITPVVFLGGMLVLRKMKRFIAVLTFELVALLMIATTTYLNQSASAVWHNLWTVLISTQLLFFAYIMLIEPLTSPRHLEKYLPYSILVGFLYGYNKLGIAPEEALLIGNIFAYLIEPNRRMLLHFVRSKAEANGIVSFVFSGKNKFKYQAGQYMEWTVDESKSDSRGNRRYFTLSSSPTEKELMLTMRLPSPASSFKQRISSMKKGDSVLAAQLSGEFVLPKSRKQKLAFIAGGVGITPFRSMVKYLVDFNEERPMRLLYTAGKSDELAFKDLFLEAKKIGLETTYSTDLISKDLIIEAFPDYADRTFYISGPYGFVKAVEDALLELKIPLAQIKVDYFPGYG